MTLFKNRNNASLAFKFGPTSLPKYPFYCVNCMPRADVNRELDKTWSFDVPPPLASAGAEGSDLCFFLISRTRDLDLCRIGNHCV